MNAETKYRVTYKTTVHTTEEDARALAELENTVTLGEASDVCANFQVRAELRDEPGSLRARVDSDGRYWLV